ncbi:MAG: hypothetical protein IPM94_09280 [bacterium]|nr:hypothetical protein [bacterium]
MHALTLDRPIARIVALDVLLCAVLVAVPALSHATAFPLYRFEPMRLLLFAAVLFSSRRNALLMALCLPVLSALTSGHPAFPKFVLIQGELALNAVIFYGLFRRSGRFVLGAAVSVLASKVLYYAAKFVLIRLALMDGDLVATPWSYQFAALLFILVGGGLVCLMREKPRA